MSALDKSVRCSEVGCLRPAWREGLCWWCFQKVEVEKKRREK